MFTYMTTSEVQKGDKEGVIIKALVLSDEKSYYERPIIPNYDRNSLDCGKERRGTPMEKTRYPQLSQYSTRLATFVHSQFFTNNQALANLGFFYKGRGDRVCCYECGITLTRWRKDDDPLLEHVRSSPECRHLATIIDPITLEDYKAQFQNIRAIESGNEATGVEREITSSQEERKKIRSPEYASYNVRLSTFARFPVIYGLDVHRIAAAGFYYTGYQDIVRCYACDGCLKRLEPEEDPWGEHYKWFPDCPHLEQSTYKPPGREIIVEESTGESQEKALASAREAPPQEVVAGSIGELTVEDQKPQKRDVEQDLNTPAALAVLDFGYSRLAVKMAMEEERQKGQKILTADGILQVLISFEDKGLKLPSDDSNKSDKTNDIVSERKYASSKNLYSEEQLTGRKSNETQTSETRDKETLLLHKNSGEICHLLEENNKLTMKMMCKRCRERQRNILVLPCTHFCLCEQCSKEVSLCPECWKPIKERVKTYIS